MNKYYEEPEFKVVITMYQDVITSSTDDSIENGSTGWESEGVPFEGL